MERPNLPGPEAISNLSDIQQSVLNCVGCFYTSDKSIEAKDVKECTGLSTNTVRSTLESLEVNHGLIKNINPAKKRRNIYEPTVEALPLREPLADKICPAKAQPTPSLSAKIQRALECVGCLVTHDLPITKASLLACENGIPGNSITYALGKLTKLGYLQKKTNNTYVAKSVEDIPKKEAACTTVEKSKSSAQKLTETQQQTLDCITCQITQGLTPDRQRVTACTNISSQRVRRAATALADKNIITVHNAVQKPGLRSEGTLQTYQPTDVKKLQAKLNPGCTIKDAELDSIHERLSAERKRILGCLACLDSKVTTGRVLPGATIALLDKCSNIPRVAIDKFIRQLITQGYYDPPQKGFTENDYGKAFLLPTTTGRQLLDLHRETGTRFNEACQTDLNAIAPIHIRSAIIRCIGCIWTQQIAAAKQPNATVRMLAECTGIESSTLRSSALPRLTTEGYLKKQDHTYSPTDELRIMLGYTAGCNTDIYNKTVPRSDTPKSYIRGAENIETLKEFEAYVSDLKKRMIANAEDSDTLEVLAKRYPRLTAQEEAFLGMIIQKSPNSADVEKALYTFVCSNIGLAKWMAEKMKFYRAITSFDDVALAALAGVHRAAKTFDPLYGTKFSTHAFWPMKHAIIASVSDHTGLSIESVDAIPLMLSRIHSYHEMHGKNPNTIELSAMIKKPIKQTEQMLGEAARLQKQLSLDYVRNVDVITGNHELIGKEEPGFEQVLSEDIFSPVRAYLSSEQKDMLENVILSSNMTLSEYAQLHSLSTKKTRYLYDQVLDIIRHPYFGIGGALDPSTFGWHEDALCNIENRPEVIVGGFVGKKFASVCQSCSVRQQCADFAKNSSPKVITGIWGGAKASNH